MTTSNDVLILDDDPEIVEALSLMLEDAGYLVRTLRSDDTLESLQENVPGVLLLDVWLSGRDGRDICKYLKSQSATYRLPIILISANNNIHRLAGEAGADDSLAKPFSLQEVVAKVSKYLAP